MLAWLTDWYFGRDEYSGPWQSGLEIGDRIVWRDSEEFDPEFYNFDSVPKYGTVAVSLLKNRPVRIVWDEKPEWDSLPGDHISHENPGSLEFFTRV
jgi:hypothetical protein